MAVNPRRSGFRLPWGADSGESEPETSPITGPAAASEPAEAGTHGQPLEAANGAAPKRAEAAAPASGASPATFGSTPAGAPPAAGTAATAGQPGLAADESSAATESDPFLQNLVDAMRGVAESSRGQSLAELRQRVEERIGALRQAAAEEAEELRRRADLDIGGIAEWERSELERVRAEAEQRREERRAQLERQLADQQATSEREVAAAQRRLAEHEQELDAFFAQLGEIRDPAAFVAAAKRMPRAPELGAAAAAPSPWGPAVADLRREAMGIGPGSPGDGQPAQGDETVEPAGGAEATAPAPAAEATGSDAPSTDSQLAERLAELDARLGSGEPEPRLLDTPTPAAHAGDTSTPIVVKGLNSFGAITSFKQALERVDGIKGVTLSLGPTGEFVYRASHAPEFDLPGAIRSVEGESAAIEMAEGTLKVTVGRPR